MVALIWPLGAYFSFLSSLALAWPSFWQPPDPPARFWHHVYNPSHCGNGIKGEKLRKEGGKRHEAVRQVTGTFAFSLVNLLGQGVVVAWLCLKCLCECSRGFGLQLAGICATWEMTDACLKCQKLLPEVQGGMLQSMALVSKTLPLLNWKDLKDSRTLLITQSCICWLVF